MATVILPLRVAVVVLGATRSAAAQAPAGQATMAWHVTIAPSWFDPSTAPPQITPFGILYALHDALVRPYPGQKMGPSLAESWRESPHGQNHEVKLRARVKVPHRDPPAGRELKVRLQPRQGARAHDLPERV